MDLHELKQLWASPANTLTPEATRAYRSAVLAAIDSESRRARGMMIYVSLMTAATTLFALKQVISANGEGASAWYAHLLLIATWVGAFFLVRHFRGNTEAIPTTEQNSIQDSLRVLHRQARGRCREMQTLLVLFASFIPLFAIAIEQLQLDGKMRPHEAQSATYMAAVIVIGGLAYFSLELLWRRLPEQRRLAALLAQYDQA
jgi:putative copper export protein